MEYFKTAVDKNENSDDVWGAIDEVLNPPKNTKDAENFPYL